MDLFNCCLLFLFVVLFWVVLVVCFVLFVCVAFVLFCFVLPCFVLFVCLFVCDCWSWTEDIQLLNSCLLFVLLFKSCLLFFCVVF